MKNWGGILILLLGVNISLAEDNIIMGEKQSIMPLNQVQAPQPQWQPQAVQPRQAQRPRNPRNQIRSPQSQRPVPQRTINGNVARPQNNNPENVNRPIPRKRVPENRRGLLGKPPSNIKILNADGSMMNPNGQFVPSAPKPNPSNRRTAFDGKNTTTPNAVSKYHSGDVFLFGLKYSFFDVDDAYIESNPSNNLVDFDIGSGYSFYITSGSDAEVELQTEFSYRNAQSNYGDIAIASMLLNVVYNFDWDIYVRPFVTVGSGVAVNLDSADNGFHDITVPYQYGVGVRFDLDDIINHRSAIFISYENFGLLGEGITLRQDGLNREVVEYDSSSLVIGLEWSF